MFEMLMRNIVGKIGKPSIGYHKKLFLPSSQPFSISHSSFKKFSLIIFSTSTNYKFIN